MTTSQDGELRARCTIHRASLGERWSHTALCGPLTEVSDHRKIDFWNVHGQFLHHRSAQSILAQGCEHDLGRGRR